MKVVYSGCIPNPWLEVAKKLLYESNLEPVYWIGWSNYDAEIDIKQELAKSFENCIFHELSNAWKGIFPETINNIGSFPLDAKLISQIASEELIAIRMMDRLDMNRRSFSFHERQRHFRRLLGKWLAIIDFYEVELFVSPSIPHRVFDYALYIACKLRNVKTIMLKLTPFKDVLVPMYDLNVMPSEIKQDYEFFKQNNKDFEIPTDVKNYLSSLKGDYSLAEPDYMKVQKKSEKHSIIYDLAKKVVKGISFLRLKKVFQVVNTYHKNVNKAIEDSSFNYLHYNYENYKSIAYKKKLKNYYESLCLIIDVKSEKYIFVALHYQPEETTCPSAGHYVDQFMLIENISKSLPHKYLVLVKEHRSQFHPSLEGSTGRALEFYDDLLKLENVKLVSTNLPSYPYIDNALAVASATGTIGWEAIVRGKAVLIFGNAWYEYCDNVFRIHSMEELEHAMLIILSEELPPSDYMSYVKAIYKNSIVAYHYKGYDKVANVDYTSSINKLSECIGNYCG